MSKHILYLTENSDSGRLILLFYLGFELGCYNGWSRFLDSSVLEGWYWEEERDNNASPIGHRCLIEW